MPKEGWREGLLFSSFSSFSSLLHLLLLLLGNPPPFFFFLLVLDPFFPSSSSSFPPSLPPSLHTFILGAQKEVALVEEIGKGCEDEEEGGGAFVGESDEVVPEHEPLVSKGGREGGREGGRKSDEVGPEHEPLVSKGGREGGREGGRKGTYRVSTSVRRLRRRGQAKS